MLKRLTVVRARFRPTKASDNIDGLAILDDKGEVQTFIHPDGLPYKGDRIWGFTLCPDLLNVPVDI